MLVSVCYGVLEVWKWGSNVCETKWRAINGSGLFLVPGVDDSSFFEYLSSFCFLSIEFRCTFSISYKILPYFVCYYCISIRM